MITEDKTSKTDSLCLWQKKSIYNSMHFDTKCTRDNFKFKVTLHVTSHSNTSEKPNRFFQK